MKTTQLSKFQVSFGSIYLLSLFRQTSLEKEKTLAVDENHRLKGQIEKITKEKTEIEDNLGDSEHKCSTLVKENAKITETSKREREELRIERERSSQVIEELRAEVERLRAVEESFTKRPLPSLPNPELEEETKKLRSENKSKILSGFDPFEID